MRSIAHRRKPRRRCWRRWPKAKSASTAKHTSCQKPFIVLATDNPIEYEGTYPLPEAQLDRFAIRLELRYLCERDETSMLRRRLERGSAEPTVNQVVDAHDLLAMRESVEQVTVHEDVLHYVVSLADATRHHPQVAVGASPRAELDLVQLARARALLLGRDYVIPEDVKALAIAAVSHRITLRPEMWVTKDPGRRRRWNCCIACQCREPAAACRKDTAWQTSVGVEFRWRASELTRAIATCAGFAMVAAVIGARWQLIAFAAPLLGVLCSISWQRPVPKIQVHAEPDSQRCFEDEPAQLSLWVTLKRRNRNTAHGFGDRWHGARGCRSGIRGGPDGHGHRRTLGPLYHRGSVEVVAHGGLLAGTGTVEAAEVIVFPMTPPQPTAIPQTELLDRLGAHLTRHIGRGVEYADIRLYVPGDQLRAVNWPVSARRGRLHVTQRLTDRAADVVVLIDGYPQPAGPATEATERVVRGAAQVVQTALRNGDRAGIVALGADDPAGWAPTSGSASSTGCSTPSWTPANNSNAPLGHWRRARRFRRGDRHRVLHAARHRIRFGADRSAQARPRGGGRRRTGGRPVSNRPGSPGGSDVGVAALRNVSRHGHRRRGRGGLAGGSDPGSVDAGRPRSSSAADRTPVMRRGAQLAAHALSTGCGVLMVARPGSGHTARPGS